MQEQKSHPNGDMWSVNQSQNIFSLRGGKNVIMPPSVMLPETKTGQSQLLFGPRPAARVS